MLGQVWNFCISGIIKCIDLTKSFVLDKNSGITLFHFLLFIIFARIIVFILEYMKNIQVTVGENENEYKKEKRYKK